MHPATQTWRQALGDPLSSRFDVPPFARIAQAIADGYGMAAAPICGVTILLDMETFDTVPIDRMIEAAVNAGIPPWLLRAALT